MAGKNKPKHVQAGSPAGPGAGKQRPQAANPGLNLPFELPDKDDLPVINMGRLTRKLPWLMPVLYSLVIISFLPLSAIYYNRSATHALPRWSLIPDMDNQPKWKTQRANALFADHRASRPWPEGTVARGLLRDDSHMYQGIVDGQWATGFPERIEINQALLNRGQERYNIYCSMCHGEAGYGDGPVAQRADRLKQGTWTVPLTYHGDQVRNRPAGHIFNTITNGIRTMPAYGSQISPEDRWAIIAWIRVLQASQNADINSLPAAQRAQLEARKPAVAATPAAPAPAAEPPAVAVSQSPGAEPAVPEAGSDSAAKAEEGGH